MDRGRGVGERKLGGVKKENIKETERRLVGQERLKKLLRWILRGGK